MLYSCVYVYVFYVYKCARYAQHTYTNLMENYNSKNIIKLKNMTKINYVLSPYRTQGLDFFMSKQTAPLTFFHFYYMKYIYIVSSYIVY